MKLATRNLTVCPALLLLAIFNSALGYGQAKSYAISGTIVTPAGVIDDGVILVANGTIQSLGTAASIPAGTTVVKVDGVVFPGLIDLHDHLVWTVFPRWK